MWRGRFKLGLAGALAFAGGAPWLAGCRSEDGALVAQKTQPVALGAEGVQPAADYAELAVVLDDCVRDRGWVEPAALKRVAKPLEAQLRRLAVTGPTVTPKLVATRAQRLAYWLNARAAWALRLVLRNQCPERMQPAALEDCEFPLDGRRMTLRGIDAILAGDADWRVVVAAPGVREDRARLPVRPFSPADVLERIPQRLNGFIDDEERFVIDYEKRVVLVPAVMWPMRTRIIDAHRRRYGAVEATLVTALQACVTRGARRRLQDAIGLRCVRARPSEGIVLPPEGHHGFANYP